MYLYAIIWDASNWATHEGNNKVNYNYGPFVATYKNLILKGCIFFIQFKFQMMNFSQTISKLKITQLWTPCAASKCKTSANILCPTHIVIIHIGTLSHPKL